MSGGYMGPGESLGRWFYIGMAAIVVVPTAAFAWFAYDSHKTMMDGIEAAHREAAAAPFHAGDIVRTRVGKLRGTVIYVSCGGGCLYEVRFPAATMEPRYLHEYELELAQ